MLEQQGSDLTPLMRQYFAIKAEYSDSILLFQVGDFYELFFDDAKTAAAYLGIALTKRGKNNGEPIPLCGVPVHALDYYLTKLVRGGFKIAIVDQLEEATPGKVVDRGVTRVLTPGTLTDAKLLDEKAASYIFSFVPLADSWGLLFGELLTAQLYVTFLPADSQRLVESELTRFFPDEIIIPKQCAKADLIKQFRQMGYFTTLVESADESQLQAAQWAQQQFSTEMCKTLEHNAAMQMALATFYAYLNKNQRQALSEFKTINFYKSDDFLILDAATSRNLELVKNNQDGSSKNSLFSVVDKAVTPMGSRMLKKWIMRPLIKKDAIIQRQDVLKLFLADSRYPAKLQAALEPIGDAERVIGRIALMRASLHDYILLTQALHALPAVRQLVASHAHIPLLHVIYTHLQDFQSLQSLLASSLNDDLAKEWLIKAGFDQKLDQMREVVEHAHAKIVALEMQEQQNTGINSLKIRYNQVHGYYIEITKTHLDAVPAYYKRQQTLVGKERYMIPQLHELQHEITTARATIVSYEKEIFDRIKRAVSEHSANLRKMAHALAHIDALLSLARVALDNNYVCPLLNEQRIISIQAGRHPVIEQRLPHRFIANDAMLDDAQSLLIITGPNMGGKSTYLRQVALIALLAHIGSFVPAQGANIAILDRIFTRIGAGDNLAEGKSTFLVEMEETAAICTGATSRSLVILDEVGRGTSTFDGLAIAQAVVEYIYTSIQARCLFATHYHELALLQDLHPGIVSYYAASKKTKEGIIFLHTMMRGVADGSFGIEVAKLAHVPASIIERSQNILQQLNSTQPVYQPATGLTYVADKSDALAHMQQELQSAQEELAAKEKQLQLLAAIDLNNMTPKQALDILWRLKENE